jgi:hypothetical protein
VKRYNKRLDFTDQLERFATQEGACLALTLAAGPVSRYALETARALHAPGAYLDVVLGRVEEAGHARRAP